MLMEQKRMRDGGERGHFGAWRALVGLPAMIASVLLLMALLGPIGSWQGLVLLGWFGCGLLTLTRPGERVAVRWACGFRQLSPSDAAALAPVWSRVLGRCAMSPDRVDLYIQRSNAVNAFAVGGRSVAVTSRVVADYRAGRITERLLAPILCHELGHHATSGARFTPVTLWLALPWRMAYRSVLRVAVRLTQRQPRVQWAAIVVAGAAIAIVESAQQHAWGSTAVLASLALFSVASPLADAAVRRASERAADAYAADVGYGDALADALRAISRDASHRGHLYRRILDGHPAPSQRIRDLTKTSTRRVPATDAGS
jgi:STE24 endopeptidase